jgi:hypothetical protein
VDYARETDKHREIAEWYRTMANSVAELSLRARYFELAEAYDRLAEVELRLASRDKRSKN